MAGMTDVKFQPALVRTPNRPDELGLPMGIIEDLFMRRVLVERQTTIHAVSEGLGITMPVAKDIADSLRDKKILEYYGMEGRDYRIGLTEHGQKLTSERMVGATYASYLPVALTDYVRVINAQKVEMVLNRETIRSAFGDLVVADELLDQLGPAFLSDGAIFLYGPPGTGKTSLAERMIRLYDDKVLVPHAVHVDGAIITVFDPSTHIAVEPQPPGIDPRWVLCDRPIVIVGGELSHRMLDLEHDAVSGTYTAPIQMQANNGILVVDDLGRQVLRPDELLNRWIVPLSRGIDFLRLVSGSKFTVPFELKLVASTNLDPNSLGDDAFLRRLRNKVFVGPITEVAFNWILVRCAQSRGIEVTAEAAQHLRLVCEHYIGELRPYVAIDFCDLMIGICIYENVPKKLDAAMINRVASIYFVTDGMSGPADTFPTELTAAAQPQPAGTGARSPAGVSTRTTRAANNDE
ncbi:MAG: hypothetical protein ACI8TP_003574 [Acidimicrobiales bacterium]|jgi:hypothetical protein